MYNDCQLPQSPNLIHVYYIHDATFFSNKESGQNLTHGNNDFVPMHVFSEGRNQSHT